jgi:hypothetical protein
MLCKSQASRRKRSAGTWAAGRRGLFDNTHCSVQEESGSAESAGRHNVTGAAMPSRQRSTANRGWHGFCKNRLV